MSTPPPIGLLAIAGILLIGFAIARNAKRRFNEPLVGWGAFAAGACDNGVGAHSLKPDAECFIPSAIRGADL